MTSDRFDEAEFSLMRTQRLLELALTASNAGIWELDVRTGLLRGDRRVAELLASNKLEYRSDCDDLLDLIEPKDRVTLQNALARASERGTREQLDLQLLGGQRRIAMIFDRDLPYVPQAPQLIGMIYDVSAEERTETELMLHQQQLEGLVRQLRQSSRTDALTQLGNRLELAEQLKVMVLRAQSRGDSISLLMIDIDHFKSFNDSFGHAAGDAALKQVAQIVARSTRSSDIAARFGGEEFCAVAYAGSAIGEILAERIRRAVQESAWPLRPVTVSIGLASMTGSDIDEPTLFKTADQALYRAKANGRNQVVRG